MKKLMQQCTMFLTEKRREPLQRWELGFRDREGRNLSPFLPLTLVYIIYHLLNKSEVITLWPF